MLFLCTVSECNLFMKPMIKYRGGKSKEIQHFLDHMPDYRGRYIEPFFGGGALYFHLEPQNAIISDINTQLIGFYHGIADDYKQVHKELHQLETLYVANREEFDRLKEITPDQRVEDRNEELYYRIRDMFNGLIPSQYSPATLYFFINKTAYSGMIRYNARGEYNVPFGRYKNFNTDLVTMEHSILLQHAQILNVDYSVVFDMAEPDDFVFLDPPYDCTFSDYGNEEYRSGFNEAAHRLLADRFHQLNCRALMVIGRTPLTEELYGDLIIDEYAKSYSVNIRNRFHSEASHILIANY